ncbi:MAG: ATP-binding protein [Clostridioides sp.]|jgi:tRNA A37 threonylcarbamoyladenosine biosynthesis protein TsaE|nr:ATP-binding protein [Clostridioides sp.]
MKGSVKEAFPGGNTSKGSYPLFDNIIPEGVNRIFCMKGGPGVGKSSFMKYVGKHFNNLGYNIELYHCPSDPSSLDALVIKELGVVMLDGTAPHIVDPKLPGAEDEIINLGQFLDTEAMEAKKDLIREADRQISESFKTAYKYLESSAPIYRDIEEKNSACLHFGRVNQLTENFISDMLDNVENTGIYKKIIHLFGSAISPIGYVDYTEKILPEDTKVHYLSGAIGTGKSTFMRRFAESAHVKGLEVQIYHYPLIPEKIETVYVPALEMAITTSYQFQDVNEIEFDKYLDKKKLTKCEQVTNSDEKELLNLMSLAIDSFKLAKEKHDVIEGYFVPNMDFGKVEELKSEIITRIEAYMK